MMMIFCLYLNDLSFYHLKSGFNNTVPYQLKEKYFLQLFIVLSLKDIVKSKLVLSYKCKPTKDCFSKLLRSLMGLFNMTNKLPNKKLFNLSRKTYI